MEAKPEEIASHISLYSLSNEVMIITTKIYKQVDFLVLSNFEWLLWYVPNIYLFEQAKTICSLIIK